MMEIVLFWVVLSSCIVFSLLTRLWWRQIVWVMTSQLGPAWEVLELHVSAAWCCGRSLYHAAPTAPCRHHAGTSQLVIIPCNSALPQMREKRKDYTAATYCPRSSDWLPIVLELNLNLCRQNLNSVINSCTGLFWYEHNPLKNCSHFRSTLICIPRKLKPILLHWKFKKVS